MVPSLSNSNTSVYLCFDLGLSQSICEAHCFCLPGKGETELSHGGFKKELETVGLKPFVAC